MHKISSIFILILSFLGVFSNSATAVNIDSLRDELRGATREKKLELLNEIRRSYFTHPDSGLYYLNWYEEEAAKQKSVDDQCKAIMGRIEFFAFHDYFQKLEDYAKENIPYLKEHKHYLYQYSAEEYLVETLLHLNKKDEAFQKAKNLYEESAALNLPEISAIACRILGYFYKNVNRYEEAYSFYKEALNHAKMYSQKENNRPVLLINSYVYLIQLERFTARHQEVVNSCNAIMKLLNKLEANDLLVIIQCICHKADAYFSMGNSKEAKACLDEAEKLIKENESAIPVQIKSLFIESYVSYYLSIENYTDALRCINQSLEWTPDWDEKDKLNSLKTKAYILFQLKRYEEAANLHYEIAESIDSLFTAEFNMELDDLRRQYETAEKEKQILKQEARLQTMRTWIFSISAGFMALAIIIFLILNYNKNIKRKNKNLTAQISVLSAKRAEMKMLRKQILEKSGNIPHESNLFDRLEEAMEKDKLFLKPDVNRDDIARTLLTNSHYLCDAIKEQTGLTFGAYIGKLRLEYAQELLIEMKKDKMSLTVIGFSAGFNSVRTFARSFKEAYGLTPGEFRLSVNSG